MPENKPPVRDYRQPLRRQRATRFPQRKRGSAGSDGQPREELPELTPDDFQIVKGDFEK